MENKNIEKMTGELLKKSLQKPDNSNFDDELMRKIMELPKPASFDPQSVLFKNGWRFLVLAVILLLTILAVISYLTTGYYVDVDKFLLAINMYILYGGLALFIPLIFTQFDSLLQIFFQTRHKTGVNY